MRKGLFAILFLVILFININSLISQTNDNIVIKDILPHQPPILIPTDFSVVLNEAKTNLTYLWNFGDGSQELITKTGMVTHVYQRKGVYQLKVKVYTFETEANKTISINAVSPKDYISSIIEMYREDLKTVENQIDSLPEWISREVKKNISIDSINSSIYAQEQRYKNASSDDEYTDITKKLLEIRIPFGFLISEEVKPIECFLDQNQLDLEVLKGMGVSGISGSREDYFKATQLWESENINILWGSETYSFYYRDKSVETLFSHIKVDFSPIKKIDKLYFAINGNPEKIILKNGTEIKQNLGTAAGIVLNNLDRDRSIEILYPGRAGVLSCPFYFSPEFNNLVENQTIITCNNDGICDSSENFINCRNDCKPFKITALLFFVLIFFAFVIYIGLQEWYKKRYESKLFPNKNDLYNIMSFMNNSIKQGLKKSDMLDKLKEMDWNGEQLGYAWKRLNGKRTGMFEIPLFSWFEKRKIQKELESRNGNHVYKLGKY